VISVEFTADVPRIAVSDAGALLPRDATKAHLDLTIEVDGQQHTRQVTLTSTPMPRRGGRRWWWLCPRCGRHARHLYPSHGLVCWRCAGLRHATQYR
jgi:hypothetical protein